MMSSKFREAGTLVAEENLNKLTDIQTIFVLYEIPAIKPCHMSLCIVLLLKHVLNLRSRKMTFINRSPFCSYIKITTLDNYVSFFVLFF